MQSTSIISTDSALEHIRLALQTIDAFRLPSSVRPHVETVLVRQVAKILDQALPWQQGHGRRTAALAQAIGSVAGLCRDALHHLTLAALLHDIGLLALPSSLHRMPDIWTVNRILPSNVIHEPALNGLSHTGFSEMPR